MTRAYRIVPVVAVLVTILAAGAHAGRSFELRPGEARTIDGVTIGFDMVVAESRCPIGLLCFWEGDAACALYAQAPDVDRAEFILHTSAMFKRQTTYAGWTITLQTLDPYPVYERPTDPSDYVVTLELTRDLITPVSESTWGRIKAMFR